MTKHTHAHTHTHTHGSNRGQRDKKQHDAKQGMLMMPAGVFLASNFCAQRPEFTCMYAARTWACDAHKAAARDGGQVNTRYIQEPEEPLRPSKLALASPESVVERQLMGIAALEEGLGETLLRDRKAQACMRTNATLP